MIENLCRANQFMISIENQYGIHAGRQVRIIRFPENHINIAFPLQGDASFLQQHPSIKILVEGHCDDRGSDEYNIALGTSRAESVRQSLLQQGVSADRIKTISYGKEKPFCTQTTNSAGSPAPAISPPFGRLPIGSVASFGRSCTKGCNISSKATK